MIDKQLHALKITLDSFLRLVVHTYQFRHTIEAETLKAFILQNPSSAFVEIDGSGYYMVFAKGTYTPQNLSDRLLEKYPNIGEQLLHKIYPVIYRTPTDLNMDPKPIILVDISFALKAMELISHKYQEVVSVHEGFYCFLLSSLKLDASLDVDIGSSMQEALEDYTSEIVGYVNNLSHDLDA